MLKIRVSKLICAVFTVLLFVAGLTQNAGANSVSWPWQIDLCAGSPGATLTAQTVQIEPNTEVCVVPPSYQMSSGPRVYVGVYIDGTYFPDTSSPDERCKIVSGNQATVSSSTICTTDLGRLSGVIEFTPPSPTSPPSPGGQSPVQLFGASLRNADYGGGVAIPTMPPNHGGTPGVLGIVDGPYGVSYISTESGDRSNALINWTLGVADRTPFRTSGTVSMCITLDRNAHVPGEILGENYGFDQFYHGQSTFSAFANRLTNDTTDKSDDQWAFRISSWYNNQWYFPGYSPPLEYDRTYRIGITWGGPQHSVEYWVNGNLVHTGTVPLPWGASYLGTGSATNFGIGDNHQRGYGSYGSVAGAKFSDIRVWKGYVTQGDTASGCPQHAIPQTSSITTTRQGNASVNVQTTTNPATGTVAASVGSAVYAYGRYMDSTPDEAIADAVGTIPFTVTEPKNLYLHVSTGGLMGGDHLFVSRAEIEAKITEDSNTIAEFAGNTGSGLFYNIIQSPPSGYLDVAFNESHPYMATPGHQYALEFSQRLYASATLWPSHAWANFGGSTIFAISDTAPAEQPQADAGPDQSAATGTFVPLDGSGSTDPGGADLTYQWTQVGGEIVDLQDAATDSPYFEALAPGVFRFELVVSNGVERSLPDYMTVVVEELQLAVAIDVKPGSYPNSINPRSQGNIPVAILTTGTFDAATVNPMTVLFGATGTEASPVHTALEDVDNDGDNDLILHFRTQDTGIVCGAIEASITGETFSGQKIEGSDSINTVSCK